MATPSAYRRRRRRIERLYLSALVAAAFGLMMYSLQSESIIAITAALVLVGLFQGIVYIRQALALERSIAITERHDHLRLQPYLTVHYNDIYLRDESGHLIIPLRFYNAGQTPLVSVEVRFVWTVLHSSVTADQLLDELPHLLRTPLIHQGGGAITPQKPTELDVPIQSEFLIENRLLMSADSHVFLFLGIEGSDVFGAHHSHSYIFRLELGPMLDGCNLTQVYGARRAPV